MTKKEFLDILNGIPDDTEIVFGTNKDLRDCVPLNALNVSMVRQCLNVDAWNDMPVNVRDNFTFSPQYKTAIVIDAIPYWYLKEKYNITFEQHEE